MFREKKVGKNNYLWSNCISNLQTSNVLVLGLVLMQYSVVYLETCWKRNYTGDTTDVKAKVSVIKRQDSFKLNAVAEEEPKAAWNAYFIWLWNNGTQTLTKTKN